MGEYRIHFTNLATASKKQLQELSEQYLDNPLSLLDMTANEAQKSVDAIAEFYRSHLESTGLSGYVIGMSGGLDSTLVSYLTAGAIGPDRVFGVCLPTTVTTQGDIDDTFDVIETLGMRHNDYTLFQEKVEDVIRTLESMGNPVDDPELQRIKHGNIQARIRMIVLRDFARSMNYLVAGTSNASERLLGYSTLAGDGLGSIDNEGIDQLFKTTARKLGKFLNLPATVMEKEPSARLWADQTDEGELGMSYENIDQILVGHLLDVGSREIAHAIRREEVTPAKVDEIRERARRNMYKSQMPPVALLNPRTSSPLSRLIG